MINFLKGLFSSKGKEEVKDLLASGAEIIDVRSEGEFANGHLQNAKNIPLHKLSGKLSAIKKLNKPIICVCASGMRSAQASNFLNKNGVKSVNGGSWHSIKQFTN